MLNSQPPAVNAEMQPNQAVAQDPPQPDQVTDAQRRINQLFGQKKAAEESNLALQQQNDNLQTQLLALQEKVNLLETGAPPAQDPAPGTPITGDVDIAGLLDQKFEQYTQKLEQREKAKDERATLSYNQQQSFLTVQREFPELQPDASGQISPQGQQLLQYAEQVFKGDPTLQTHWNGPYVAALIARGILSGQQPAQADPSVRAAASAGVSTGGPAVAGGKTQEIQQLKTELDALTEKLQWDPTVWGAYRDTKIRLAMLTEPDKVGPRPKLGPQQ